MRRGWRKASYSGNNGGACVEVANGAETIAVRDAQDREGPRLAVSPESWSVFTGRIQQDS